MKPIHVILFLFITPLLLVAAVIGGTVGLLFTLFRLFVLLYAAVTVPLLMLLEAFSPEEYTRRRLPDAVRYTLDEIREDWISVFDKFNPIP